jgi:hypothetical protein
VTLVFRMGSVPSKHLPIHISCIDAVSIEWQLTML